jgi:hypothetical protein
MQINTLGIVEQSNWGGGVWRLGQTGTWVIRYTVGCAFTNSTTSETVRTLP